MKVIEEIGEGSYLDMSSNNHDGKKNRKGGSDKLFELGAMASNDSSLACNLRKRSVGSPGAAVEKGTKRRK